MSNHDTASNGRLRTDFADARGPILADYLDKLVEISRIPGICVAISSGEASFSIGRGREAADCLREMDRDTEFQLGCVASPLVTAIALELAADGRLNLDAPITLYLPEIAGGQLSTKINSWHLTNHTAGYSGLEEFPESTFSWEWLFETARSSIQIFEPGSVFNYDRLSLALLCTIVERVARRPLAKLLDEHLLDPLAISMRLKKGKRPAAIAHRFDVAGGRFLREGASSLWHEMRRSIWMKALPASWLAPLGELLATGFCPLSGSRILSEWTVRTLRQRSLCLPAFIGAHLYELPIAFGAGLAEFAPDLYGWDGTGFGQSLALRFTTRSTLGLAVCVNAYETRARAVAVDALLRELGILNGAQRRTPMSQKLPFDPARLAGPYAGTGGRKLTVSVRDEQVEIEVLRPSAPTIWTRGSIDHDGRFTIYPRQPISGMAFFLDSHTDRPCIQIGLNAYKQS